ncbi:MAG TPA: proteasome assembly chaperone family protein [Methanocorpusculum sp.]|nr:proteasome assembly chaperone family protein [Methanocorpusculum sp.]HJJ33439.1 proteasome assembly chaperone family protein [Methanocorpusculum sp.]HJJ44878.1 proteasome assembly chaperone family protein [Methanocorpusculum sp.]HJJ58147.1 proteasome assembly chaperone family protein [Methanocorpusculum sp.]HJJ59593.1 proteasome assembly chaperone family protein [Methanocorpusculum sp.]
MNQVNIEWEENRPQIKNCTIAAAGLPGVGHVGKLVVDHLVRTLKAKKIAEITSTLFPPQMYISEEGVLRFPRNEVWYAPKKKNSPAMILLTGDCQSVGPEGHYILGEAYADIFAELGVKRVYTLGGYGLGRLIEKPRVLAAVSSISLKQEVLDAGALMNGIEPVGGIIGAAGLIVMFCAKRGIEGISLLGETSGYLVDPVSSTAVLDVFEKLTGLSADRTDLCKLAEEMQHELSSFANSVQQNSADDLRYIG